MSVTLLCSAGYLPSLSAAGKGDNNHNGYPSRTILPESRKTASSVMTPPPCVWLFSAGLACNTVGKDRIKYQNICRCGHDEHFVDLQHVLDKR